MSGVKIQSEDSNPAEIIHKFNRTTMAMPTIDGHFWVERDGKKIDPYFEEYDAVKRVHKARKAMGVFTSRRIDTTDDDCDI